MAAAEVAVWGMHAGRTGDAETLFLERGYVAIGWRNFGNPAGLPADREAFKKRYAEVYPDAAPMAVAVSAGQIFRFVHETAQGDIVVYRSKRTKQVHVGRITGPFRHDPAIDAGYPNLRSVNWEKALPLTHLSQGALYELGATMSLFLVRTYADEFRLALGGQSVAPPVAEDDTVAAVAEDIEQNTRDFILKRLAQELKGHPLQDFIAHLLGTMGYRSRVVPPGPDGGVDIVAHRDELGFEPPIIKVQVKSGMGTVGNSEVAALYGNVGQTEFGLFIALSTFSSAAKSFAKGKSNLRLIDGDELVELVLQHYEQFDSLYKGKLPLKKVYVPQPLTETEA